MLRFNDHLPDFSPNVTKATGYTGRTYSLYEIPELYSAFSTEEELLEVERKKSMAANLLAHVTKVRELALYPGEDLAEALHSFWVLVIRCRGFASSDWSLLE